MLRVIPLLFTLYFPALAFASPLVADISSHRVEIHSGFTGTQLLLFGARNDPGDIVIVMRGPSEDMVVRKKERQAGIWVNSEQKIFRQIPQFYGVASNKPLDEVRQFSLLDPLALWSPFSDETPSAQAQNDAFYYALQRILTKQGRYTPELGRIDFMGETLFKAVFNFPDHMPRGTYSAEAYLFSDGQLSGVQSIPLQVYKTGFDAFVYDTAQNHPFTYGAISVFLALFIGWGVSWLFRHL